MITRYGDWTQYARRMLSGKGAPTFALWSGITITQMAVLVYLLGEMKAKSVADLESLISPWTIMTDPKVLVSLLLSVVILGMIRSMFWVPMNHVLRHDQYVSASQACGMALRGGWRVIIVSMITTSLVLSASSLATLMDIKLSLFVELPLIISLAIAPFVTASGKSIWSSLHTSLALSRRHWMILASYYTGLFLLGQGLRHVQVLDVSQGVRLFFIYVGYEVLVWIVSQSLFATIVDGELDSA